MRTVITLLAAGLLALLCGVSRAEPVEFADSSFEEDDWDWTVRVRGLPNGNGDGNAAQRVGDGNGDSLYWEIFVTRDPDTAGQDVSTGLYSFASFAVYDPFLTGPIESVDLSIHGRQFGGGSGGTVTPALLQDDSIYIALGGQPVPEQDWAQKTFAGLTESSFIEPGLGSSHPDFSAGGAPIVFGFAYVVSTPSEQTVTRTAGFDDWRVTITPAPGLALNPGLNDAWFDPPTAGQGFFVTVYPDLGLIFLAWFTYDTERPAPEVDAMLGEPGHRWVTAIGPYADGLAVLDVELTTDGVFDAAAPPVQQQPGYGTIMVRFTGCDSATLKYEFPQLALAGTIPLRRLAPDNIELCEALL